MAIKKRKMTVKRRITPEVVEAYRRALALHNDQKSEEYEEDGKGGRRRAYYEACDQLECLVGRYGEEQILDAIGSDDVDNVPTGIFTPFSVESWREAVTIRLELERLSKNVLASHR
jgi:hypothetical protein